MKHYYYTSNNFKDYSIKNAIDTTHAENFEQALAYFSYRKNLSPMEFANIYIILTHED